MHELLIALSKMMPEETLIDELSEALTQYKITKSEDAKRKLAMHSTMVMIRFSTEKDSTTDTLKEFKEKSKTLEMFDNKSN